MTDPNQLPDREERRALIREYIAGQEAAAARDIEAFRRITTAPSPSSPEYGAWLADQYVPVPLPDQIVKEVSRLVTDPRSPEILDAYEGAFRRALDSAKGQAPQGPQTVRGVDGSKDGA
ncbi:hypothetical protein GTY62_15175 [Streptomyces sp. SID724]|uniref:hypothetical protein n=1 Tax=Streptomyces sp. SID724 TaxID=2690324 RepID=UPI001361E070|nr:hypothetical protein [Streptomyces sp. SID724]